MIASLIARTRSRATPATRIGLVALAFLAVLVRSVAAGAPAQALAQLQDASASAPVLAAGPGGCVMVFGHGRNFEPSQAAQNEHWDQVNLRFNQQVVDLLNQSKRSAHALVLQVSAVDLARNVRLLLDEAQRLGCAQVLETTVFADAESSTFKARLRLYPVHGMKGPRSSGAGLSIGQPLYTNERGFELNQRNLERLRPELLARTMTDEFLQSLAPAAPLGSASQPAPTS